MPKSVRFEGVNVILKPAPGDEETVGELAVQRQGPYHVSCWEFTAEEIEHLKINRTVYVCQLAQVQPPIMVSIANPLGNTNPEDN